MLVKNYNLEALQIFLTMTYLPTFNHVKMNPENILTSQNEVLSLLLLLHDIVLSVFPQYHPNSK